MARPGRVPDVPCLGPVPAEFRGLPVAVLRDGARPSSEVHPAAWGGVVARFAALVDGDGQRRHDRARHGARGDGAPARGAFFYREDRKRPLADRVDEPRGRHLPPRARQPTEKADRLVRLIDAMGGSAACSRTEQDPAREAVRLAKADLTTLMVREFTELQGVMGGIYLRSRRRVAGRWRRRCSGTTTRSRSRRGAARLNAVGSTPRVRGRVARGQARHAGRLLRHRPDPLRAAAILRPAPRRTGRHPRAPRLLEGGRDRAPAQPAAARARGRDRPATPAS